MEKKSASALRSRRARLLRTLPSMEHVLRGSLIERYLRCGKPGCKCAQGEGHGPKFYLSVSFAGHRPQMDYVRQGDYERVSQCLSNYQQLRAAIEEICEINRELLRRREAL
jgi:hypothetical protein